MRIGIEAQRLFREHKHGMERVTFELIKNLQEIDKQNEYFIFVKPNYDSSQFSLNNNFKIIEIPSYPYPIWEQYFLPRYVKKYKCDLLHCTSSTAPLFVNTPLLTTIHDIIYLEKSIIKQLFSKASIHQKLGNLYRRLIVSKVIQRRNYFITVSKFEKKNITNYFNFNSKTIKVVYNGVSEIFCSNKNTVMSLQNNFSLPKKYILHISNNDPRKNTNKVLEAFCDYKLKTKNNSKLVVLGMTNNELKNKLKHLKILNNHEDFFPIKYVSDKELAIIYKYSEVFLFPSLREGFGLPVIEAMSCGVPVITSNSSSMPEISGNATMLINPNNTNEICDGIIKIQTDTKYKNELIQKGLERSKQFTWNKMASEVLKFYKEINSLI
jgi:glycosyltransferase involved in cell wall biosynthesis